MFTPLEQTELEWNFIVNSYNYPDTHLIAQLALKFDKNPYQLRNLFRNQKYEKKAKNCEPTPTAHEPTSPSSSSSCSTSANSDDPLEIFCSIDCPSCLTPQNPVSVNPSTPSPIPTIHNPHPLATQSSSPCPHCKFIFKLVDQHFSDNSMTPHFETMDKLMHIPWSNTRPLMDNWPDTSDLYRRMNQNLDRFVNELI